MGNLVDGECFVYRVRPGRGGGDVATARDVRVSVRDVLPRDVSVEVVRAKVGSLETDGMRFAHGQTRSAKDDWFGDDAAKVGKEALGWTGF